MSPVINESVWIPTVGAELALGKPLNEWKSWTFWARASRIATERIWKKYLTGHLQPFQEGSHKSGGPMPERRPATHAQPISARPIGEPCRGCRIGFSDGLGPPNFFRNKNKNNRSSEHRKVNGMRQFSTSFGNCIHCSQYRCLDPEGLCKECAVRELELVEAVQLLLKCNPRITRAEIAEGLKLDINRLEAWIRNGKIRCVSLRSQCPRCGRPLINQFFCRLCGLNVSEYLNHNAKQERSAIERILQRERDSYRIRTDQLRRPERFDRSREPLPRLIRNKNK